MNAINEIQNIVKKVVKKYKYKILTYKDPDTDEDKIYVKVYVNKDEDYISIWKEISNKIRKEISEILGDEYQMLIHISVIPK